MARSSASHREPTWPEARKMIRPVVERCAEPVVVMRWLMPNDDSSEAVMVPGATERGCPFAPARSVLPAQPQTHDAYAYAATWRSKNVTLRQRR